MVLRLLNRLFGRTDSSVDEAVNAYVDGLASPDEIQLVERMMREDSALEKDLTTQQGLREILTRIDSIEAPRSFAITPEMVAVAEGSESGLFRIAELFAPQRKLALAPAIIAGIAALSVALLTLGDITGVVDQSSSGSDDSGVATVVAESSAAGASRAFTSESASVGGGAAATDAQSAPAPEMVLKADTLAGDSGGTEIAADTSYAVAAPSLAAEAPAAPGAYDDGSTDTASSLVSPEKELATESRRSSAPKSGVLDESKDEGAVRTENEPVDEVANTAVGSPDHLSPEAEDDGISLPLWQLQLALAALAVIAIGSWVSLRRTRGE
ncbi:MAG: hypothetical protein QGF24_02350 [Dehalococcoidia bacterium]|nr:hypothetical protein [Dehalococcoidia bacterium]